MVAHHISVAKSRDNFLYSQQLYRRMVGRVFRLLSASLLALVIASLFLTLVPHEFTTTFTPVLISVVIFLSLGVAAYLIVSAFPKLILTPLPLFLVFTALTLGLGPLYGFLAADDAIAYQVARWNINEHDRLMVAWLNLIGLISILIGLLLAKKTLRHHDSIVVNAGAKIKLDWPRRTLLVATISFLIISIALRLPSWMLGIDIFDRLPGALSPFSNIGLLAVLFAAMHYAKSRSLSALLLLSIPLTIEIIVGAMTLMRGNIVMPLVMAAIGLFVINKKPMTLAVASLIILVLLIPLRGVVDAGRYTVWGLERQSAAEFWLGYLGGEYDKQRVRRTADRMEWWSRWDYTPIQNALRHEYLAGRPGDTYRLIPWAFIPRVLYPQKPAMDQGVQVSRLLVGLDTTSIGTTPIGEAYWNGGWGLVIISGIIHGYILWAMSLACLWLFSRPSIIGLAIGLYGIMQGVLIRNFFSSGVIAGAILFFVLLALFVFYRKMLKERPTRSTAIY